MKTNEIYYCPKTGITVEVISGGEGTLSCNGEQMQLMTENTVDAAKEKHIPVVHKTSDGIKVNVGEVTHPMEEKHHIGWIEVVTKNGETLRKDLKPSDSPEAEFKFEGEADKIRGYCNLHGLWKTL